MTSARISLSSTCIQLIQIAYILFYLLSQLVNNKIHTYMPVICKSRHLDDLLLRTTAVRNWIKSTEMYYNYGLTGI